MKASVGDDIDGGSMQAWAGQVEFAICFRPIKSLDCGCKAMDNKSIISPSSSTSPQCSEASSGSALHAEQSLAPGLCLLHILSFCPIGVEILQVL